MCAYIYACHNEREAINYKKSKKWYMGEFGGRGKGKEKWGNCTVILKTKKKKGIPKHLSGSCLLSVALPTDYD